MHPTAALAHRMARGAGGKVLARLTAGHGVRGCFSATPSPSAKGGENQDSSDIRRSPMVFPKQQRYSETAYALGPTHTYCPGITDQCHSQDMLLHYLEAPGL